MAISLHRVRPTAKARLPFARPRESGWRSGPPRKRVGLVLLGLLSGLGAVAGASRRPAIQTTAHGFRAASTAEQSGFALLSSTAIAIAFARVLNYVREQRRPVRPLKNVSGGDYRVHHYLPGIGLALVSGGAGLVSGDDRLRPWLALGFGTGAGLVLDEVAVLVEREDVYWNTERLAAAEGLLAFAGASALAVRFFRVGRESLGSVEGYCVRERKKVQIQGPEPASTKDGRPGVRGTCPDCGAKIFRLGRAPSGDS